MFFFQPRFCCATSKISNLFAAVVAVSLISLPPLLAHADTLADQIRECARKESNFQRLECFDAIAEALGGAVAGKPAPTAATPTALPKTPQIRTKSRNPVTVQKRDLRPELKVSCVDKKLTVQIDVGYPLPSAELSVNTRVDQADVRRETWGTSTSGGKTVVVIAPFPAQLVRDMLGGQVFEAKVMVSPKLPIAFSFDVGAIKSALEALRAECVGM